MNHWSSRRKRFIFVLVLFSLIVLVAVPVGFLFYEPPTCFDSKTNGDEEGVDCGGSCQLLCPAQSLPLITKGDPRVLEVAPGFYEVVAVVENPNVTGRVDRARYRIKLYEATGVTPMKIIEGETFVPRSSTFVVFEGPFETGEAVPSRAILEWQEETLIWQRDDTAEPDVVVRNMELTREETEPRVTALLVNNSLEKVSYVELVALISDEGGNLVAASKTLVDTVGRGESAPVIFTWLRPFQSTGVSTTTKASVDIVWRVLPDLSYIR